MVASMAGMPAASSVAGGAAGVSSPVAASLVCAPEAPPALPLGDVGGLLGPGGGIKPVGPTEPDEVPTAVL
jgi:hypothetical protein